MDINKIVVSNKLPFGNQDFRYFIGFKDAKKVKPLYIFLSKMRIDKRDFDKTIYLINVFFLSWKSLLHSSSSSYLELKLLMVLIFNMVFVKNVKISLFTKLLLETLLYIYFAREVSMLVLIKGPSSGLRQFPKPFEIDKKCFFMLKALLVLEVFTFLS